VFTLGYQGNQTRHLFVLKNYNAVVAANGLALNPAVETINFWQNAGNGNYNAMVATFTHNFARTFQASAQYTWAKTMDENSGPYYEDPYPFDTSAAYGRPTMTCGTHSSSTVCGSPYSSAGAIAGLRSCGRLVSERHLEHTLGLSMESVLQHYG